MKLFYCDEFVLPLPPEHRFPMAKYRLLRERVLADPALSRLALEVPAAATDEQLLRAHSPEYVDAVVRGRLDRAAVRRLGFPWSPQLVERSRRSVGGTVAAARHALGCGVAANLAGGTHHAFRDRGTGYCVFNDSAVAARAMQSEESVGRVLILDCDVHQGDGTAAIFRDDPSVVTCSIHGALNFPFRKERSDIDIALPDGTGDDVYLDALQETIGIALRKRPELVIYLAGADPFQDDRLGRLSLTREGLRRRDAAVLGALRSEGTPVAVVMAGGYARDVERIVDIHFGTLREAAASVARRSVGMG
jgi:acetoin utilization deacetylase AcuC-like enzyme